MAIKRCRGLAGLDAMILMIAVLLAASVVAIAIFSTSQSLAVREQTMQKEKSKGIQKPIIVDSMRGIDADNDKRLDVIAVIIRLKEGSDPFQLNETVILVNSKALNCSSLSYGNDVSPGCGFNVTYLKRGPDFEQDRMNLGDLVELRYSGGNIIRGVESFESRFNFIPPYGVATEIRVDIPERIFSQNMGLWPLND